MNEINIKSEKTKTRIDVITMDLKFHYKNLNLIRGALDKHIKVKKSCFTSRKIKYSCLPRDEKNFLFTIQNIKFQIWMLERELVVLNEYGQ